MHFYQHHIGDFNNATRHLSIIERAIYRDLLDMYYEQESAIDATDLTKLQRRLLIRSTDEKQALEFVLDEFFENTENGWIHNRCESELKTYQAKAESNRKNGGKGGRPKTETKQQENENQSANQQNTPQETQSVNSGNPQKTLTKNHKPLTNIHTHTVTREENSEPQSWSPNTEHLQNVIRECQGSKSESILAMPDFKFHLGNFNAHWENKIDLTEKQRTRKFAVWLIQEFEKLERKQDRYSPKISEYSKPRYPKSQPVSRNVNDAWEDQPVFQGTVAPMEVPEDFL